MKKRISNFFLIAFLLWICTGNTKLIAQNCFVSVYLYGNAYKNTPVQIFVGNVEVLTSKFTRNPVTDGCDISLFFLPHKDSCYYVADSWTWTKTEHKFRPFFYLEGVQKVPPNIFPLKVVVDGIIMSKNIDLTLGQFIRVDYEYERGKETKVLKFVQTTETIPEE